MRMNPNCTNIQGEMLLWQWMFAWFKKRKKKKNLVKVGANS